MKKLSLVTVGVLLVMFTLGGIVYAGHGRLNVNIATADEFQWIPGIDRTIAQNIVQYRQANGQFTSLNDLLNVNGIGEVTLKGIKDYLKLEGRSDIDYTVTVPKGTHSPGKK
ncbi:MAG: helix-hairpin-helix domain-containing protein [Desulfomonilia bacterium]|nr:helix-hairpin-helix domain-containing protein [Desulfomonilia bacterium]